MDLPVGMARKGTGIFPSMAGDGTGTFPWPPMEVAHGPSHACDWRWHRDLS